MIITNDVPSEDRLAQCTNEIAQERRMTMQIITFAHRKSDTYICACIYIG